ncbi:MAG TPA: mononuclear molybdenum enzyme YedY, partial [Dehalococcoidia bacterium]|nr:mononuclear molybdenum enzyme YedY [Dehalococcoidia bacterium]
MTAALGRYDTGEPPTDYQAITTYNNFYEFGLDKADPALNAHTLQTRPWTISVEGEVAQPQVIDIDTLLGWFPLADLIRRQEPTGNAKYVEFTTLLDQKQMPGQRFPVLKWPY